ncbi:MAG: DUF2798 domain-containing protein [Methylophilaceae bacterium]
MIKKLPGKYRQLAFAAIMSAFTVSIVSATITLMHVSLDHQFLGVWAQAFCTAWPIVFAAILLVAPLVNKVVNIMVD